MDYLTEYPVSAHPETWPLNSVYLSVLERQIEFWQEKGYEWKWSAECEFTPSSSGDILDLFKSEKIRIEDIRSHEFYSLPPLELLETLQNNPVDHKEMAVQALTLCRQAIRDMDSNRLLKKAFSVPEVTISPDDLIDQLDTFEAQLHSDDNQQVLLGVQNIFLAFLNLMPSDQGGLLDLIQPRFGDSGFGLGWWDGPGIAEVRPNILDPIEFIKTYHRVVEITRATGLKFGLISDFRAFHLNFSVHRVADGKNMFLAREGDRVSADFSERALVGIQRFLMDAFPLIKELDPAHDIADEFSFTAGSTKFSDLRMRANGSWEYRRSYHRGLPHLARDISMFMIGAARGNFDTPDLSVENDQYDFSYRIGRSPIVRPLFGQVLSPIQAVLESSDVTEEGYVIPDIRIINETQEGMREYIGENNLPLFKGLPSHAPYKLRETALCLIPANQNEPQELQGLDTIDGLVALFQSLRIGSDGKIETNHLHPEIGAVFSGYQVTGYRTTWNSRNVSCMADFATQREAIEEIEKNKTIQLYFEPSEIEAVKSHHINWYKGAYKTYARALCARLGYVLERADEKYHTDLIRHHLYTNVINQAFAVVRAYRLQENNLLGEYKDGGYGFPEFFVASINSLTGENPIEKGIKEPVNGRGMAMGASLLDSIRWPIIEELDHYVERTKDDPNKKVDWEKVLKHVGSFLFNPSNQIAFYRDRCSHLQLLERPTTAYQELYILRSVVGLRDYLGLVYTARLVANDDRHDPNLTRRIRQEFSVARDTFLAKGNSRLNRCLEKDTPIDPVPTSESKELVFEPNAIVPIQESVVRSRLAAIITASFNGLALPENEGPSEQCLDEPSRKPALLKFENGK